MTQLNGNSPTPQPTTEHNEVKPQQAKGALLHELAEHRHDPEFIAQSFRSGEYPYKTKISNRTYETQKKHLPNATKQLAGKITDGTFSDM